MKILLLLLVVFCTALDARTWQSRQKTKLEQREQAFLNEEVQLDNVSDAMDSAMDFGCKTAFDVPSDYVLLERPAVIVHGPERNYVICESELQRPTIYGAYPTWQSMVDDELIFQEAIRYKVPIDDTVADKYILSIRKQYNMSMNDVNAIFKNSGLSPEQGKQELTKMYTKNTVIEHKILSRVFVSQQEVDTYYHDHPIIKEAQYQVQIAVIPYNPTQSHQQQQKIIMTNIKTDGVKHIEWSDPIWLKSSEIADDKQFILKMKPQSISKPVETIRGFEIVKLCAKKEAHPVPLEKRYREIVSHLREQKAQEMVEHYVQELRKNAAIAHCV